MDDHTIVGILVLIAIPSGIVLAAKILGSSYRKGGIVAGGTLLGAVIGFIAWLVLASFFAGGHFEGMWVLLFILPFVAGGASVGFAISLGILCAMKDAELKREESES